MRGHNKSISCRVFRVGGPIGRDSKFFVILIRGLGDRTC